jgi:hypothetical protein
MSKPDGGCVYPLYDDHGQYCPANAGITRRDWLAGLAMQGELSSQAGEFKDYFGNKDYKRLVEKCYEIADAMIAEGEK